MNQLIRHRGPDDSGFVLFNETGSFTGGDCNTSNSTWKSNTRQQPTSNVESLTGQFFFGMGHRRLSILDLSPNAHQPFCDESKRYWISYNGEVYNYIELKNELSADGCTFQSDCDTEVILQAYLKWGIHCQERFLGMWAFCIYDTKECTIFMSRDRYGVKPLYYWFNSSNEFFFASEIKQFTGAPGWSALLNKQRAYDFLYYASTDHTEETLFVGVKALPAGHYLLLRVSELAQLELGAKSPKKWFRDCGEHFTESFEVARQLFRAKFIDSVNFQLRSDVTVGSALSGGLDSSSVVACVYALLSEQKNGALQNTFSSCSTDVNYDERAWMEKVVEAIPVSPHYLYPDGKDLFSQSEEIVWHMDEPYQSQSPFLAYHVFREARRHRVSVLLNGQGADEYLSGYGEYRNLRLKRYLFQGNFSELRRELSSGQIIQLLKDSIKHLLPEQIRYQLSFISKENRLKDRMINHRKLVQKRFHLYEINQFSRSTPHSISEFQIFRDPLQKYLRYEDRTSMAHSVEARVPFLDHRLVEFTRSLPLSYLDSINCSKRILVEAMDGLLPEEIRMRKDKKGFMTPEERWLKVDHRKQFIEFADAYLPYAQGLLNREEVFKFIRNVQDNKIPFDYTYWRLICFCIWMKVFRVSLN